jgi:hypothetical protein
MAVSYVAKQVTGMGEIEKVDDLDSRYRKLFEKYRIEKSCKSLVKISLFRMKKLEINEPI